MSSLKKYKKLNASAEITTLNTASMAKVTGNLYETVVIISKRSNQIAQELKQELSDELASYTCSQDNLEEIFEDEVQIDLSRKYERVPKPSMLAVKEYLEGRIIFNKPSDTPAPEASEGTVV